MRPDRVVLVGHPVFHSLSPRFQNAALAAARIPLVYEALDVPPDVLDETMRVLVATRAAGNVTIPHKEAVFALCGRRTPVADRVGAVNTFWVEDDVLVGHNTDVGGFDAAARIAFGAPRPDSVVAVLGAGGAAAACLAAIERWPGATALVASRTPARSDRLIDRFARVARRADSYESAVADADMVVNATPLGLQGEPGPIDPALLRPGTRVFDLVYQRGGTRWTLLAKARGLPATDGLRMLVEQGALAFERWFGVTPDREVMWESVAG